MPRMSYDHITRDALTDEGMPAKNRILFHCFNPNGVYAQLKAMHKRLDAWLDAHPEMPNGVLMVHGSLNNYPYKLLFDKGLNATRRRKNVRFEIDYAIKHAFEAIAKGDEFINNPDQWPSPKGTPQ